MCLRPRLIAMTRLLTALALVGLLTGLAGCGDSTATDPGGSGSDGDAPAAGDYVARELPEPFEPGDEIRFQVTTDGIGWSATCNTFSGGATWDDGTLRTTALGGTEMGCDEDRMAQDEWLVELFGAAPSYTLDDGGFTLTRDDVTLTFRPREEVHPDRPLEGTRWVLDGYGDGQAVSSIPAGGESSLVIEGGRMTLELPCNGTPQPAVKVGDGELEVEGYATTEMSCGEAPDAVESAVVGVVQGTVGYDITAGSLTLTGTDGRQLFYVAE